ncbi:xanthine dehydrogenase/oxidase-like [Penaeus japonicus]|uniref:xanthine dehydrogenase/oxidase-like n=1 Tax=Penaeus japonicus TaxID=27405 RepID=UPI001C70F8FA|nr:xanthine dehydrogenase/oxidase-like [Penaeus japonicus]
MEYLLRTFFYRDEQQASTENNAMAETVKLTINGQQYEVDPATPPSTRLVDFLHEKHLSGTHVTCYQGGCGACTVVASFADPDTGTKNTHSINSCLAPLLGCNDWEITTVEGLGNRHDGYHVIQERLAEYSGTQCGYCSPGMVMNMYGLTQSNSSWSPSEVEQHLDGNLCRCTGYRPILDAFKSITVQDIEDSHVVRCPNTGQACRGRCAAEKVKVPLSNKKPVTTQVQANGVVWHQPASLQDLYGILAGLTEGTSYRFVCGDTAQAVYYSGSFDVYIYTRHIPELSRVAQAEDGVVFGANVSISRVMEELETVSEGRSGYDYAKELVKNWHRVASTSVRNLGSWAGNLGMKLTHREFPSDIFINLLGAGAVITTALPNGSTSTHTLEELLELDLQKERRVILEMRLPPMADNVKFRVFKVMGRTTNTHAFVNAAMTFNVDEASAHTVIGKPLIVYGGINPTFVRASATEAALEGKSLEDEGVLQAAMQALANEVKPDNLPQDPAPEYRLSVAQTLLYKMVLGIVGDAAAATVTSGATDLERPLSSGQQTYDQNTETWPLGKPIPKLEARMQCAGEAEYVNTMAAASEELFGMFVTATQANAHIASVDPSAALAMPDVVAFVGVDDIKGVNNIMAFAWPTPQPLFPKDRVSYYGQPIGLVVTKNRGAAYGAREAVKVTYDDIQPPVLTIEEALQKPPIKDDPFVQGDVQAGFAASTHIFEGAMSRDGQYHFHMESQSCLVVPTDIGMDVYASTQWASETQRAIGQVLGIADNTINVTVKRLGGAFGAKIDQCNIVTTAAAVAAQKVRKPVRVALDLDANMTIIGWREPYLCTYKVGVDDAGVLQAIQATLTCDSGYVAVDSSSSGAVMVMPSCYSCPNWEVTPQVVLTNTACNTWCRTPGTVEGIIFMENILEHVAEELSMDPLELRRKNLMPDGGTRPLNKGMIRLRSLIAGREAKWLPDSLTVPRNLISGMIDQILTSADVEHRKQLVAEFNQKNLWKKRGLSVMPMLWPYAVPMKAPFNAMVSVNARDGTVVVSHGGTELGQGINTKVAQCAAYELGIPLDMVAVRPSNTHVNANSDVTGGSQGSDVACFSVSQACKKLRSRLDAAKEDLGLTDASWPEIVLAAFNKGVDICERYVNGWDEVKPYPVFGVACTEVELDVLTGQFLVLRTDILEDAGKSISPLVDVGQVEGAYVMGQGLFTVEKPLFDSATGRKVTDGTWYYTPPAAQDIPVDFRVSLLHDAPNPVGVQSSKVTGEPALCLAFAVVMALRQAVASARRDAGVTSWFQMDTPLTVDNLQRLCLVESSRLVVNV